MAKKNKNTNSFIIGNDPNIQKGLNRLRSYNRDIAFSTQNQASPYYYGGALSSTNTDELSYDYIGRPIQNDVRIDEENKDLLGDYGSWTDSWRLFNKKQTESDLTAARWDLQDLEQNKQKDIDFAQDLMNNILLFKQLKDLYSKEQNPNRKNEILDSLQKCQQIINQGYERIQKEGRQSDILRSLFFDTSRNNNEILIDLLKQNTYQDDESDKLADESWNQVKNGWNKGSASDVLKGSVKYAWSGVENIFGVLKNIVMSTKRGLDMILPQSIGGTEDGYNPYVDKAIRESDNNDKRYDKFIISADEFANNSSKVNKFDDYLKYWNDLIQLNKFEKSQDIKDLQDKYTNGSWYFNPKAIDPVFEKIQEKTDLGILGGILHPQYGLPELGSSFSDFKHFATLTATDLAIGAATSDKAMEYLVKKAATTAVGGWYGKFIKLLAGGMTAAEAVLNIRMTAAAAETAANVYLTEQMRKNETKQEVFDAYNERMTKDLIDAGVDINKVIEEGNKRCEELGIPVPVDPVELFKNALLFDIDIDDPEYKNIADRNKVGLNKVYNENQTLAAKDFIEGFAFMPYAGKAMRSAFYRVSGKSSDDLVRNTLKYQSSRKTSDKLKQLVENGTATSIDKADYYINKFIDKSLNKAFTNPATRVALTRPGKYILSKAKQIMSVAPLEGLEEGQQQLLQQRYSNGEYDDYSLQKSDFSLTSLLEDQNLGAEALVAYLGSYVGDPTEQELEIRRAMNIGFTTALWFGAPHVLSNAFKTKQDNLRNLLAQLRTDMSLRKYVAETYPRQEDDYKVGMMFDRYQKAGINAQRVIDSLEEMKKYKGGFQGDLITDEYIQDDQKLAAMTYNVFKSDITEGYREDQNIAKGSNEHKMLVQNAVRDIHDYENVNDKYNGNNKRVTEETNKIINEMQDEIRKSVTEDPNDSSKLTVNPASKYNTFLNKILKEYNAYTKNQKKLKEDLEDDSKNKQLLKEAEDRILERRKKELLDSDTEITDEIWEKEKESAKNNAKEEARKYLYNDYSDEEKKKGIEGLTQYSLEEYAKDTIESLIAYYQQLVYKRLIKDLSIRSEQMKLIHSELGSDINIDTISSFIDILKEKYDALKGNTKLIVDRHNEAINKRNAAIEIINQLERAAGKRKGFQKKEKRFKNIDLIIESYGEFGNVTELLKNQGLAALNSALLTVLSPRVSAYTQGTANPMYLYSSTRSRKWSELSDSQKEEYRSKIKLKAQDEGKKEPSEKSIASSYNMEQRQKRVDLEKIRDRYKKKVVELNEKNSQQKTISEEENAELFLLSKEAANEYVKNALNERIENYQERKKIYHLSYEDPVTRFESEEDKMIKTEGDNTDHTIQTEGDNTDHTILTFENNTDDTVYSENPNDDSAMSDMSPEMKKILGLDRVGESSQEADVARIIGAKPPVQIPEKKASLQQEQDAALEDSDKNLPHNPTKQIETPLGPVPKEQPKELVNEGLGKEGLKAIIESHKDDKTNNSSREINEILSDWFDVMISADYSEATPEQPRFIYAGNFEGEEVYENGVMVTLLHVVYAVIREKDAKLISFGIVDNNLKTYTYPNVGFLKPEGYNITGTEEQDIKDFEGCFFKDLNELFMVKNGTTYNLIRPGVFMKDEGPKNPFSEDEGQEDGSKDEDPDTDEDYSSENKEEENEHQSSEEPEQSFQSEDNNTEKDGYLSEYDDRDDGYQSEFDDTLDGYQSEADDKQDGYLSEKIEHDDDSYNGAADDNQYDEYEHQSHGRNKPTRREDVESKDEAIADYLSSTFFYSVNPKTNTKPVVLGVNTEPLKTTYEIKPAKELSEKLSDKKWIHTCDCYYVCSGNLNKKGEKNKDAITVSLVIDDHNSKSTYVCFLKTPGVYSYGQYSNQKVNGEQELFNDLYKIGLKDGYTEQMLNDATRIAIKQKYQMLTGDVDPIYNNSNDPNIQKLSEEYTKKAFEWFSKQDRSVKLEIWNSAHRSIAKDGKRILTIEQIWQQIANLKKSRNAIIEAYCDIDEKGNITIPKQIKKNVRPSKSSISVSNGTFNNQKDDFGRPIYRNITEIKTIGVPQDTEEITNMITNGDLQFGFGRGKWGNNPYAISSVVDPTVDYEAGANAGKSGSIYLMVDIGDNKRVPVQLISQKFDDQERGDNAFFVNRGGDTLQLCIDPKTGKINTVLLKTKGADEAVKPSLAELILYMVCNKLNVEHLPGQDPRMNLIMLDLIVNTGDHTLLQPDQRVQNDIKQLSDKQIALVETEIKGQTVQKLVICQLDENGNRRIEPFDLNDIFDEKDDTIRKKVIYSIKENLHWNTLVVNPGDKSRSVAMTDQFPIILQRFLLDYFEQNPNATEYNFCGLRKVSFKKADLFNEIEGELIPKNCNVLSWMITNGHILTDVGDTLFRDPFVFANGLLKDTNNTEETKEKHPDANVPGGVSVKQVNTDNNNIQSSRNDSEKIEKLSKQKQIGINTALNKRTVTSSLASDEQERLDILRETDGVFDIIALSAELKLSGAQTIDLYKQEIKKCIQDYIDFVNKENKLGKSLKIEDVNLDVINRDNINKVNSSGYTPVLQVTNDGRMLIFFQKANHLFGQGKRITGIFSKVKEGKSLTQEEAEKFLMQSLGIDRRNIYVLDHIYDILTGEEVYGVVEPSLDILTGNSTAAILLSKENKFGSTYHEAFHYVNLVLNTKQERLALYKEFVKRYRKDLKDAIQGDIEEQLAIKFQSWMEFQTDLSVSGKIKRFFKKLWDIINIFKKKDLVRQTFEMIQSGGYKSRKIDKESYSELKRVYDSNPNNLKIPGIRKSVTQNLPKQINSSRKFYDIASSVANRFLSEHIVLRPEDLGKLKGTPYTDFMNKIKEEAKMETDALKRTYINAVVDNPEAFLSCIIRAFDEYGVKVTFGKKKIKRDDLDVSKEAEGATSESKKPKEISNQSSDFVHDIENLSLSKKDNVAFRAKMFLGLIEKKRFSEDAITGDKILIPEEDEVLGYPMYYSFSESWGKILKDCWSCETYDDIDPNNSNPENPYAKNSFRHEVRFRSKSDEFYAALDEKLDQCYYLDENFENTPDVELQNQILSTIKSSYPNLGYAKIGTSQRTQAMYVDPNKQSYSESEDSNTNTSFVASDIQKDFTIFSDNAYKSKRMLPREWSKLAIVSGIAKYKTDSNGDVNLVIDKEYVEKILKEFEYVENQLLSLTKNSKKAERRKISNEEDAEVIYRNVIFKIANIMNNIGIPADDYTLEYLMYSNDISSENSYVKKCKQLQDIVMKSTGSLGYFLHNVIQPNIGKNEIRYSTLNDNGKALKKKTTPIDELYYGYNDSTFITKYAVAFSAVHPSSSDFSISSPDNKKLYPIGDNNFITDTTRRGNNNIDKFIENFQKCPYQKHSILMDVFKELNKTGAKKEDMVKLMAFIGLKDADKNEGVDYFGMTRLEDFVSKMVLTFGEVVEENGEKRLINRALTLPTMADKKTYYAIICKLLDQMMCDDIVTNTISSENGVMRARRFSNSTLRHFHGYFLDELNTIEQYYSRENILHLAKHPGKARKNYHGKRKNIGTKQNPIWTLDFSGNGGLFRYCYDFIKDENTGLNLNEMLEAKYRIQELSKDEGNKAFRDGENEIDGFENVRKYIQELKQRYSKFNEEIADGINKHLISQIDDQLFKMSSSTNLKIVQAEFDELNNVYNFKPKKIPRAILQYYIDKIQKQKGSKFRARAYSSGSVQNEAAYCAIANHYVNTLTSMIEYEKIFSGDQAQYKWSYFSKKINNVKTELINEVTVDGVKVRIRTLRDKNTDRVKRLGAGLSPGKNLRTQYGQEILEKYPELKSRLFTNAYMSDLRTISQYIDDIKRKFKADRVAELLMSILQTDKNIIDNILKDSNLNNINDFIHGLYYGYTNKKNVSYYDIAIKNLEKYKAESIVTIDDEVARQSSPYEGINVSDAQVLVRPELYRKIRIGWGEWSFREDETGYSDEKAYRILEKDDSWMTDPEKARIVKRLQLYPLKATYFDTHPESESPGNYLAISRYNKQAIFPLFKFMTTSKSGMELYERMNRKGNEIDMLTFDSAVKVGGNQYQPKAVKEGSNMSEIDDSLLKDSDTAINPDGSIVSRKTNSGLDSLPVLIQSLDRLLKQLNTEAHTEEERAIGTQMFKIAFSDVINKSYYGCNQDGTGGRTGKEIRSEIMACINALSERGTYAIANEYLPDDNETRLSKQKKLIKQIIKSNDLGNIAMDIIENDGCVSSLVSRKTFEQSVAKKVMSNVVEIHTKGGSAIQQSVFGFVGYNNNAVTSYNGNYTMFNEGKALQWYREDGSMEVLLSMNFFKAVIPLDYQDTYEHMRQWLIDHDVIKGLKSREYWNGDFNSKLKDIEKSITDDMEYTDIVKLLVDNGILQKGYWAAYGREIVMANINGVPVPFYRSSNGTSGKTPGKWYQFFGYGNHRHDSTGNDWLVKGRLQEVEDMYGSPELQQLSKFMDKYLNWIGEHDKKGMHSVFDFTTGAFEGDHFYLGEQRGDDINKILYGTEDPRIFGGDNAHDIIYDRIKQIENNSTLYKTYSNPKPFGVGYRIPTQGMSSMFAFVVADVLPEQSGDLVIVPEEFTAQTGSDFDVDKLFLATMSYDRQQSTSTYEDSEIFDLQLGKNMVRKTAKFRDESISEGAIQNRLLKNYIDIITDPKNFALSRASIDVFTSIIVDDIVPQLRDTGLKYAPGMYELSPIYQSERKMEFTTGKDGIGSFALNITNHALTLFTDLCMYYGDNIYGLRKLNAITGQDGRHILGWLSAMVNAHVDVAKDPYVFTLNVNSVTYNMTNFLIRAGKGKATFSFIAQPILKRYADLLNSEGGLYGNNDGTISNESQFESKKERIQKQLIKEYYNKLLRQFESLKNSLKKEDREFWEKEIAAIKVTKTGFLNVEKCESKADVLNVKEEYVQMMLNCAKSKHAGYFLSSFYQLMTMKAFQDLSKYADEMSALVLNSRIDTKKFGNNIADQINFLNNYNLFKYNMPGKDRVYWYTDKGLEGKELKKQIEDIKKSDNPREAVLKYFSGTFLEYKLLTSCSLVRQMLRNQSFTSSDTFRDIFVDIMGRLRGVEVIQDPKHIKDGKIDPNAPKAYSRVYNTNTIQNVATAIENLFRARCLIKTNEYQNENYDHTGPIDFTMGGDKQAILDKIEELLYGNPEAKTYGKQIPLFHRISNFITYLKTIPTDESAIEDWQNNSYGLVDINTGKITNDFLNFLNPVPPTKNYPQGRLLLKTNQKDTASIKKDALSASYNDLLTHPSEKVRELARDIAIYAFYTSYDQNTRDAFFELVPPYFRKQYDRAIKYSLYTENKMKTVLGITSDISQSGKTVDEKYEDIMDLIARNYWYDNTIIPIKIEPSCIRNNKGIIQLKNEDKGLVPIRYKNQSKKAILTYGIIITDNNSGDYFTVKHDKDIYLYKKVGEIDVVSTEAKLDDQEKITTNTKSHSVYYIIPKLGRHTSRSHLYELVNDSSDGSVYLENDLPSSFEYKNLNLELMKYINDPRFKFNKSKPKIDKQNNKITLNIEASFREINKNPIRGYFDYNYEVHGENYMNYDGDVRFQIVQKHDNPVLAVLENSTFVLNFGQSITKPVKKEYTDKHDNKKTKTEYIHDDKYDSKIINIGPNDDVETIIEKITNHIKTHNISNEYGIKIGQIGDKFNVTFTEKEKQNVIKYQLDRKYEELILDESLTDQDVDNTMSQYKKFLNETINEDMSRRKKTLVFLTVLDNLIQEGFTIDTTSSTGVLNTDRAFINASRIISESLTYQQSYVALPRSYEKVDHFEDYQRLVSFYDKEPEYITDMIEETQEELIVQTEKQIDNAVDKLKEKEQSEYQSVLELEEGEYQSSSENKDGEYLSTTNDTEPEAVGEVSAEDMFAALGMSITPKKINEENKNSRNHENCSD